MGGGRPRPRRLLSESDNSPDPCCTTENCEKSAFIASHSARRHHDTYLQLLGSPSSNNNPRAVTKIFSPMWVGCMTYESNDARDNTFYTQLYVIFLLSRKCITDDISIASILNVYRYNDFKFYLRRILFYFNYR